MEAISRRVVILLALLSGALTSSCGNTSQNAVPKLHERSAEKAHGREMIADYRLLSQTPLPIDLDTSLKNGQLTISIANNSSKSIFAPRNLLSQGMAGVPLVFLVVKNAVGRTLYVCGRFEDPPSEFEAVEIAPNETKVFDVSMAELRRRYCTERATVSVQVVEPIGRSFLSFARSAEVPIN